MVEPSEEPQTPAAPAKQAPWLTLGAASTAVLLQELLLIRWLGEQVRVVAYFPNLVLISAFLGLGWGCLLAGRRSLLWAWPLLTVLLLAAARVMSTIVFTDSGVSHHLWLLYVDLPADSTVVHGLTLPIGVVFVLSAVSFVPLGQVIAQRLQDYRAMDLPLRGYCWDLGGSLCGVVVFAVLNALWAPPLVALVGVVILGAVLMRRARGRWIALACGVVALALVASGTKAQVYSPYYALGWNKTEHQLSVTTNGSLHQVGVRLLGDHAPHAKQREEYAIPYRLLKRPPRKVLIIGAGTGNDVAVALAEGASEIVAVEIDPAILDLGRREHPDKPYDSPRVRAVTADARSFLQQSDERFDLIVFGTLDSMTRASALSSVRLDNFVYTVECLRDAARRLTPEGGIAMYFAVGKDHVMAHLLALHQAVFGPPVVKPGSGLFNALFLNGPAFAHVKDRAPRVAFTPPTDDWPFLYLDGARVEPFYLKIIALLLVIAAAGVFLASRELRQSAVEGRVDVEMFLYGAAFLLLETRAVTTTNLLWGATWITSSVVFGSILAVLLGATILAERKPPSWKLCSWGLVASLVIVGMLPAEWLVLPSTVGRLLVSTAYVAAPIFFAGLCFAKRFETRADPQVAFGWNLLGAVVGGLVEFLSMALGLQAMVFLALFAYLAAFGAARLRDRAAART